MKVAVIGSRELDIELINASTDAILTNKQELIFKLVSEEQPT